MLQLIPNPMDYSTFYKNYIFHYWEDDKGLRVGQFFMNELAEYNFELYKSIPPELDCFYDDTLFCYCSDWVSENWKDTINTTKTTEEPEMPIIKESRQTGRTGTTTDKLLEKDFNEQITEIEEPEMPITKPEFYDNLTPGDKTRYNVAEEEVSNQWSLALARLIDEIGEDAPSYSEWDAMRTSPEKLVEYLRELMKYREQLVADEELERCIEWVSIELNCTDQEHLVPYLREYRRPKPTLKSQALKDFETVRKYREQLVADEELEACCAVMEMNEGRVSGNVLRAIRRPKPTLKSQALKDFETVRKHSDLLPEILDTIENALKSLPDT
jgi:hypothetical protein